jgi:hypothetical protein
VSVRISPLNPTGWQQAAKTNICVFDWNSEQTVERLGRPEIIKTIGKWGESPQRGRFAILATKPLSATGGTSWFARDVEELISIVLERVRRMPAHQEIDVQIDSPVARQALIGTIELLAMPNGRELLAGARRRSVFIATPIARQPVHQYTLALALTIARLQALGIRAEVQTVIGSSNLAKARNTLAAVFMASDFDDFLFIDDDISFNPKDVLRLLGSDKELIAGVYCKKTLDKIISDSNPEKWILGTLDGALIEDEMGAIEIEALGTGFMKISRAVFSRMKAAHPEWKRRGHPTMPENERAEYYQYFRFDPDDPKEHGEDVAFCHAWRALGGKVWADPAIKLVHVGEFEYTGSFQATLQQLRSATGNAGTPGTG